MNDLLIMKFGGTSMGSAERIRVAAGICAEQRRARPVLAVVSAMSKVTDLLVDTLRHAEADDEAGMAAHLDRLAAQPAEAPRAARGRPTTLGRGGSDFSASILAASLGAAELWIWTDVDGIMSADPRSVPEARVLEEVTYHEAAELAYNGAKVLHPRTLAPLIERQIPVWSKNSFNLAHPGTRIAPSVKCAQGPTAVTSMANVTLISIELASSIVSGTRIKPPTLGA